MYKCKCCGNEIEDSEERDRGEWCIICFPPTKMFGGCGKNLCDDKKQFGEYVAPLILGIKKTDGSDFTDEEIEEVMKKGN